MITRALNPARVNSVKIYEDQHRAEVFLDPDQVSLAIGKGGLNIKLASMLVGYTIDVFREVAADDDDVSLDEFTDAIEPWIIEELKKIGFETARDVLGAQRDMIVKNADLEEETVDEVLRILQAEFEEE
jgi:N utilization substance protein A